MTTYLSPEELSARLPQTTPALWAQLRFKGTGPKFLKPSPRKVLYRWSDVEEWLATTQRTSTRDEQR